MDFSDKNLSLLFEIAGNKVYLTQSLLSTWIVMAILILFAIIVRISLKRWKSVPHGFQNLVELLVETMNNFTKSTMGAELEYFGGYFFTVFAFVLLSNYSGMFTLRPPTSNLSTTIALALFTFFLIHITGIAKQRGKYFKEYLEPVPFFLPLNLIGEITKPISLAFRLFGNILGGLIILGLVYELLPIVMRFLLPTVLHAYFDVFAGALQAFIFTILSMTFIAQKAADQN